MDRWMLEALLAAGGFAGGFLVARALWGRPEIRALRESLASARKQGEADRERILELSAQTARLEEALMASRREQESDREKAREAREAMENRFRILARESLRENSEEFLAVARRELLRQEEQGELRLREKHQELDGMVRPLQDHMERIQRSLESIEKERVAAGAGLAARMAEMSETQKELRRETANLVRALRSPQGRGRWGELQLRRVVEMAGMLEHCDFVEQPVAGTPESPVRPDMVIKLPGDKNIVVDAKTPLEAYLTATETPDPDRREEKLREHAAQVKRHITQLGQKAYWQQFGDSPEFVVMFLPGDPFFSAALEHDPSLIEYGMARRVILSTPTTLVALLKSVAFGWQQDQMTRHARQISALGQELYERIRVFAGHFRELEKGLNRSVAAYNRALGSFEGRILVSARRFEEYGIPAPGEEPVLQGIEARAREAGPGLPPGAPGEGDPGGDPPGERPAKGADDKL